MRAVITGATGAVGMALVNWLLGNGDEVTVILRPLSERNSRLPSHPRLKKTECSLDELSALELDGTYDAFFHLAWEGTTGAARNDAELQMNNARRAVDAVCLAHRLGCRVFVGVGSQAEYGRVDVKLSSRTPAFPETGYGIAKLCAGHMTRLKCGQLGIRHVWARILSVYGEYDGERSLIMTAIRKLLDGEETEFTAGEQLWDYLYSGDAARLLTALAERGRDGGVYCLGGGKTRRLREYIEIIRDNIAPDASLGFGKIPYSEGQVTYLCADTSELERDIGELRLTPFEEGIRRTIDWYAGQRKEK